MEGVRVAYTLEQCWHRVPGGTAVSALEVARAVVDFADRQLQVETLNRAADLEGGGERGRGGER